VVDLEFQEALLEQLNNSLGTANEKAAVCPLSKYEASSHSGSWLGIVVGHLAAVRPLHFEPPDSGCS